MLKLNLGSGNILLPDYINLDAKSGDSIFPLPYETGSVDEIRASHVLEHFPHWQVQAVLAEWVRVLKPLGVLKVAVPDLTTVARRYLDGEGDPTQAYLMGGQIDENDYHRSAFNADTLAQLMRNAGLLSINGWQSDVQDCASLPISLNLMGWKRAALPSCYAIMSVPRLGFMDAFFCWYEALTPLRIPMMKFTGAFWGQCMERGFEQVLAGDSVPEFILALDYDTIFDRQDVEDMLTVMACNPDIDALAPIQSARSKTHSLFTVRGDDGKNIAELPGDYFSPVASKAHTAHFGCTLIRTSALRDLKKPWFHSKPDADGSWHGGRLDDDTFFWDAFAKAGKRLCLANRVAVGHMELMIRWPGDNESMAPLFQNHNDYAEHGVPEGVWQ